MYSQLRMVGKVYIFRNWSDQLLYIVIYNLQYLSLDLEKNMIEPVFERFDFIIFFYLHINQ